MRLPGTTWFTRNSLGSHLTRNGAENRSTMFCACKVTTTGARSCTCIESGANERTGGPAGVAGAAGSGVAAGGTGVAVAGRVAGVAGVGSAGLGVEGAGVIVAGAAGVAGAAAVCGAYVTFTT